MSRPYLTLSFGGFLPHISTYAMCVLIDWTWLNNVCLQLIRRPHRLRFTSRSFRAERALQLLAVPVETDLAILISDFADFSALLPQVSNLNSSSSHLVSFHGCGHWKSDSHNQENRMCHENPLHHVYIVRLVLAPMIHAVCKDAASWASGYCRSAQLDKTHSTRRAMSSCKICD